jgi:hypothetical protein
MKLLGALLLLAVCYAALPPQVPVIGVYTLPDEGDEPTLG